MRLTAEGADSDEESEEDEDEGGKLQCLREHTQTAQ